jgi:multicomponent Na+:H+ antiporter subunit F
MNPMVSAALGFAILVLIGLLAVGLERIRQGESRTDALLAAQLGGTTGIALMVLFAHATGIEAFYDVALVLALLAPVVILAFVRLWRRAP